ncbi:LuxR C-terminal-related transcriptional regulator [Saccharothrix hoggarensis]|uniref:LuxR C-terminal-related transcriptional regulator n=1 Tax=Saccharothrix hoggarensis TaxID=913853 RepID=A0ABW3QY36_9PSEU
MVLPNEVTRWGLTYMLHSLSPVKVVHGCAGFREAVTLLENRTFDIVLLSADAREEFDQVAAVAAKRGVKTVALLRDASDDVIAQASTLTADGFILESAVDPRSLEDALLRLQRGDMVLSSSLARKLITELRRRGQPRTTTFRLTPREQQALSLLAEGMSNKQIGRRLGISVHGAKRHVANLLAKLNCPNRTLAVAYAIRDGLLTE